MGIRFHISNDKPEEIVAVVNIAFNAEFTVEILEMLSAIPYVSSREDEEKAYQLYQERQKFAELDAFLTFGFGKCEAAREYICGLINADPFVTYCAGVKDKWHIFNALRQFEEFNDEQAFRMSLIITELYFA